MANMTPKHSVHKCGAKMYHEKNDCVMGKKWLARQNIQLFNLYLLYTKHLRKICKWSLGTVCLQQICVGSTVVSQENPPKCSIVQAPICFCRRKNLFDHLTILPIKIENTYQPFPRFPYQIAKTLSILGITGGTNWPKEAEKEEWHQVGNKPRANVDENRNEKSGGFNFQPQK